MSTIKIALTGGPCAGKTTILEELKKYIKENTDYNLIVIPETATELSLNVVRPQDVKNALDFQDTVLKRQVFKENEVYDVLKYNKKDNNVIICDRGIIDNKAYLSSQDEFDYLLNKYNKKELEILEDYDLVIYLESVSHHDNISYGFNNKARYENKKEAAILDDNTFISWLGHRNLRIVKARENKQDKIDEVIDIIKDELNKISCFNIENYEIDEENSDLSIYNDNNSKLVNETDYYLDLENNGYKYIITKRSYKDATTYVFHAIKYDLNKKVVIEEKSISKEKFLEYVCKYGILNAVNKEVLSFYENKIKYNVIKYDNKSRIEFINDNNTLLPSNIKKLNKIDNMDEFISSIIKNKVKKLDL